MIPSMSLSLQITQKYGKLGFNIEKPKLEIRQPESHLEIVQAPATMKIDQGLGKLNIDGEDARAALSLKSSLRLVTDVAAASRQIALQAVGDIAAEGDFLAKHYKGNKVEDIALQRQGRGPSRVFEPDPNSYLPVHLSYEPHETRIDWTAGGVQITPRVNAPEITYTPGAVNLYVAQQNWIQIEPKGQYMNMTF